MQEQLYAKPYDYYSSEGQATEVNYAATTRFPSLSRISWRFSGLS